MPQDQEPPYLNPLTLFQGQKGVAKDMDQRGNGTGTGRGRRRRGNRGRAPKSPAWVGTPFSLPQCPLGRPATSSSIMGSVNECQPPPTAGPLQPITRFCRWQDGNTPGAAPSTDPTMDRTFMAQVLRLLQDASPGHREQLFWDVYTRLADYFGEPRPRLRHPPNFRSLTRLSPSPRNQLTLCDPAQNNRFQREFEEMELIGEGGFGRVVKARNRLDRHFYAVKIISMKDSEPSPNTSLKEVWALAKLNHPRIVRYHNAWLQPDLLSFPGGVPWSVMRGLCSDVGGDGDEEDMTESSSHSSDDKNDNSIVFQSSGNGQDHTGRGERAASNALLPYNQPQTMAYPKNILCIQMGLCGESLKDHLEERMTKGLPVAVSRCLEIFQEVLEALSYIHKQGLIHRDVKPANIFFTLEGHHIQLGDFGLAILSVRPSTTTSHASNNNLVPFQNHRNTRNVGTALYAAPEVTKGIYGQESDMYSMGIILLELISPFRSVHQRVKDIQNLKSMQQLDHDLADAWPDITQWILKLTDPEPDKRPTPDELLASTLFTQPVPPLPPPPSPPAPHATDTTASEGPAPANKVLVIEEAIADARNLQSEVPGSGTFKMSPIEKVETLRVSRITAESSVMVNTLERCLSTDEENAILREENVILKRKVEELERKIQRLTISNSNLPVLDK